MESTPDTAHDRRSHPAMAQTLGFELVAPLAIFYGVRVMGADQLLALLLAAVFPLINAVRMIVADRRISGVTLFVLATMVLSAAMSYFTGSPRMLLLRDSWATAAMGLWILVTLLAGKPFLYEGTRIFLNARKQAVWARNWDRFPPFRRALRVSTAVWGCGFLVSTAIRVVIAIALPIDLVPVLEYVLLALTVVLLLAFQRICGTRCLRHHNLQLQGVHLSYLDDHSTSRATTIEGAS